MTTADDGKEGLGIEKENCRGGGVDGGVEFDRDWDGRVDGEMVDDKISAAVRVMDPQCHGTARRRGYATRGDTVSYGSAGCSIWSEARFRA